MKPVVSKAVFSIGVLSFLASFFIVIGVHAEFKLWNPWATVASTSLSSSVSSSSSSGVGGGLGAGEQRIVDVVKRADPSVVSVIISKKLPVLQQKSVPFDKAFPGMNDPFFQQFQIQVPQYVQKGTKTQEVGGGTAFFVTSDGLLMTNKHVVEDPKAQYTVLLNDGRKLSAKVASIDPVNDIALLKVEGSGFTPLTISSEDTAQLGQTAIAIGNALGEFRNTVSVGVVSGLQRSIQAGGLLDGSSEQLDQILQTDAAINEGNSGGPLLDSRGEVIGMNTAIAASAQNIGFALPAVELRQVLASFQKNGRIVRAYIGIRYVPVTADLKSKLNLSYDYGVLISSDDSQNLPAVVPGSPAAKAGLQDGDLILEVDGHRLTADVSLLHVIEAKNPGDTMTLKIARSGKEQNVTVTLVEWKQ